MKAAYSLIAITAAALAMPVGQPAFGQSPDLEEIVVTAPKTECVVTGDSPDDFRLQRGGHRASGLQHDTPSRVIGAAVGFMLMVEGGLEAVELLRLDV